MAEVRRPEGASTMLVVEAAQKRDVPLMGEPVA